MQFDIGLLNLKDQLAFSQTLDAVARPEAWDKTSVELCCKTQFPQPGEPQGSFVRIGVSNWSAVEQAYTQTVADATNIPVVVSGLDAKTFPAGRLVMSPRPMELTA